MRAATVVEPPVEVASVGAFVQWVTAQSNVTRLDPLEGKMARCLKTGDYDGALFAASVLAYQDPKHPRAQRVKTRCVQLAKRRATARVASPNALVVMVVGWDELRTQPLSREEAFVLSLVDGLTSVGDILDISSLEPRLAHDTLMSLVDRGLVSLRE